MGSLQDVLESSNTPMESAKAELCLLMRLDWVLPRVTVMFCEVMPHSDSRHTDWRHKIDDDDEDLRSYK